jgi:hypothetical protein
MKNKTQALWKFWIYNHYEDMINLQLINNFYNELLLFNFDVRILEKLNLFCYYNS